MSTVIEAAAMDGPLPTNLVEQWERFFAKDGWQAVDVFRSDLHPLQRKRELARMLEVAKEITPRTVMEIGADKGSGLLWWCCAPSVRRVIACEIRGTPYRDLFEQHFPNIDFLWLPQSSHALGTLHEVQEWLNDDFSEDNFIDVLFIDGDKSRFAEDFLCCQSMMRHGSVAFFHDIQDDAPRAGYDWICRMYPDRRRQEIVDTSEVEESFRRNPKPINGYDAWLRHWHGRSCGVGVIHL